MTEQEVRAMKEFLAKQKAHLIFGSGFLLVLAINIITGYTSGQTLLGAIWNGASAIKPMDYVMFALFWHASAVYRPGDEWHSPLISLNLSRTSNEE
jgi:hypothetical protein